MVKKMRSKYSLNVSISPEAFRFLESKVEDKTFSSWSHGVELALAHLKKELEEQ